ncbi:hypothetical protein ACFQ0T_28695 [Kitasatospora gansuensis]
MTSTADRLGTGAFGSLGPRAPRGSRSERGQAKAVTEGLIPAYELRGSSWRRSYRPPPTPGSTSAATTPRSRSGTASPSGS